MRKQLKVTFFAVILCLMIFEIESIARAPVPYCSSKILYKQIALAAEEYVSIDMSNFFSGYNLHITKGTNNSFADIHRKQYVMDEKKQYFAQIISHYVQPKDNSVGRDSFLLYKSSTGAIMLTYGIIRDKSLLPETSSTLIVTTDKNVQCFDAAMFLDHGLGIVDCVKKGDKIFSTYQNIFYIVDFTDHSIKKMIQNDMYIGYTSITKRKLTKFNHPEAGGFTYLLRTYLSDGVDKAHSDNTYMEIFIVPVQDPTQIEPLRIIDRTFLSLNTLRIMDVEIYLDDIFLLDYDTGLYRLDILESQRVAITGRYTDYGFEKFGVYSDDLQDELIIALANKHSIYEIDWHAINRPVLINKYSIMENSTVKQIFLNDRYLIVQASAMAFNKTNPEFEIDNTWIFTKGSRTYLNAYHVIHHNSSIVQVDFDRSQSRLYIADEAGLTLRALDSAKLVMHYIDDKQYGTSEDIVIFADSFDRFSNETFRCQESINIQFMSPENTTILSTGIDVTSLYSINYPKPLQIPLQNYYRGADIKYKLLSTNGTSVPSNWINKVNFTAIRINPDPSYDIVFFHCHVDNKLGYQFIRYYYQDNLNNTHFAECEHQWTIALMDCKVVQTFNHTSRIRSLAVASFVDNQGYNVFYSIVFDGDNKNVYIYNYLTKKLAAEVLYKGEYEAEVSHLATSNGFLYVTRPLAKVIDVYSLRKCADFSTCKPDFSITKDTLNSFKIKYFAPVKVVTDDQHPEVIFIKCLGSLIILDIDNKQKIVLLDEIISPPTYDSNFQIAVSKTRLIITAYPNMIFEYSLENLYVYNMVVLTKVMPIYGFKIQPNADIQFSDYDSTVYVNAYDPVKNVSVILIYRTGKAASNSLYSTIYLDKLYSRPGFQVQVGGYDVNFLSIVTGKKFTVYRVFTQPFVTVNETLSETGKIDDFSFAIQATNEKSKLTSESISVKVVNQIQIITPTQIFNNSNANLIASQRGEYMWQDREWFDGSVIHLNYSCEDCHKGPNSKVRLREHIDRLQDLHVGGNHYTETYHGGLSVYNDIFRFRPNGSVYEIGSLPDQKSMERCVRIAASEEEKFSVTACQQLGRGINLYVTTFVGFKPFTWGPFKSDAYEVRNLQIINDILMLVDTPMTPSYLTRGGEVYLYRLSFNGQSEDQMDELQIIDSNDFAGCPGWNQDEAFLGNAHFHYSTDTNSYRLYITEVRYGMFVVDFLKTLGSDNEITILATSFIDIKKLLEDNKLHMPTDATFVAVDFVKSIYNPVLDMQNVIVTTKGYDNFEISLVYDKAGFVSTSILHRVYKRYSFYDTFNDVHARSGFIVVGYILPPDVKDEAFKSQYVVLYDSTDYPHESDKGYSVHSMVGAIPINTSAPVGYTINTTYDFSSNGTRSGIVVSLSGDHRLFGASISHNLTLSLAKGYKSQNISMKAYNDFSQIQFNATLIAEPDDDETGKTIIIVIIVLSGVVVVFLIFYISSVMRKKKPIQERQSLLTENQNLLRQSVAQPVGQYSPPVLIQEKAVESIIQERELPIESENVLVQQKEVQVIEEKVEKVQIEEIKEEIVIVAEVKPILKAPQVVQQPEPSSIVAQQKKEEGVKQQESVSKQQDSPAQQQESPAKQQQSVAIEQIVANEGAQN